MEKRKNNSVFSSLILNRPVFQNRHRFTGSPGSHRFRPVPGFVD
jgi:hypothetical protein